MPHHDYIDVPERPAAGYVMLGACCTLAALLGWGWWGA